MKKILFAVACAMVLGSCSGEQETDNKQPSGSLTFEISAVNSLQTRADLYSQEPIHEVERVSVYVFKESGSDYLYLKTFEIPSWAKGSGFQRYEVPNTDMLPGGNYRFLVVGRDLTDNFTLPTLTANTTNYNDFIVSISAPGQETEIFAGSKDVAIVSQGMRVPITITRQVAGVLGYFKNIPADIGGTTVKFLRLSVSNSSTEVNLTTGVGTELTGTSYNLINVDLSSQTVNSDGAYVGNDLTSAGIVKVDNSQLNGAFVLPVNGVSLTLGLYDASNNPLKTWTILNEVSANSYNILPNHFYTIGTKVANGSTTGTPDNPTPDSPVDLMRDQSIAINISPNWVQVHDMAIQ
jgi:Protein of unknown function (DUF1812).